MKALYQSFMGLFHPSNPQSKGVYLLDGRMATERLPYNEDDFQNHLDGSQGLGLVPITPDSMAQWGAIDLDAHGDAADIDLAELETKVRKLEIPVTICRSKSGGAHLYVFLTEPMMARDLRNVIKGWVAELGFAPSTEIFPKQDTLQAGQLGNWINLCYFDHENTIRYAVEGGIPASLEFFVESAESRRVNPTDLLQRSLGDHMEAPPCIQKMLMDGVDQGSRNMCLFHFAVYAKQALKDTWEGEVSKFNENVFTKPLRLAEVNKVINSANGRGYKYKCNDEYIKTLCDAKMCVKRDFGIPKSELDDLDRFEHPKYGPLKRIDSDPVVWLLFIEDRSIQVRTIDLMSHRTVRIAVAEQLHYAVPPMKENIWFPIYATLMEGHEVIDEAPEMSIGYTVMTKIADFVRNANPSEPDLSPETRWFLEDGGPCIQRNSSDEIVALFRGQDILDYLKHMRVTGVDAAKLAQIIKTAGGTNTTIKAPKTEGRNQKTIRAWSIPLSRVWDGEPGDIDIKSEF